MWCFDVKMKGLRSDVSAHELRQSGYFHSHQDRLDTAGKPAPMRQTSRPKIVPWRNPQNMAVNVLVGNLLA